MRMMLVHSLLVGAGGFVGAMLRYGAGLFVTRHFPTATFPWATLSVNLAGCLLIGLAAGMAESRQLASAELRVFVIIGLLGGFTTFSAFGFETFSLLRNEEFLRAAANVGVQVVLGVLLVWTGYSVARP